MSKAIDIIFGAAAIGNASLIQNQVARGDTLDFSSEEGVAHILDILKEVKVTHLDTAQIYGGSEEALGKQPSRKDFTIDTKIAGGFIPGHLHKDEVVATAKASINDKLKLPAVDVYYIHSPDSSVDLEDTLAGIDAAHKQGLFKHFGLSNYKPEDVQKVYDLAKSKGYVLPTVYQGNYNPVARKYDTLLFPILRKLGISFRAYSPIAGGFLTKSREDIESKSGRFDASTMIGAIYVKLYSKPSYLDALSKWQAAAEKEGVSKAELAYRWVSWHSSLKAEHGDGIIIGAKSEEQIRGTVSGIRKGPLSQEAVKAIDDIWEGIKHEAPLDNYHDMI